MIKRKRSIDYTKYRPQPFLDGYVVIKHKVLQEPDGWEPRYKDEFSEKIRFERRMVGVQRYYSALHADQHVEVVIRIPFRPVDEDDTYLIYDNDYNGKELVLLQYQVPVDVYPRVVDLSLGYKTEIPKHEEQYISWGSE